MSTPERMVRCLYDLFSLQVDVVVVTKYWKDCELSSTFLLADNFQPDRDVVG